LGLFGTCASWVLDGSREMVYQERSQLVQNEQAVESYRREVQAAAKLTHPNIVTRKSVTAQQGRQDPSFLLA
jgi:hypothetical protein